MDFMELISKQEELDPELGLYLEKTSLGTAIKHPLLIQMFYNTAMNAFYNEQLRQKKKYVEESLVAKKWSSYIWLHERPYRIEKFMEIMDDLGDEEYWDLLGSIWSDSENLWQYKHVLKYLLNSPRPGREKMMTEREQNFFNSLPEQFTIYRGHQGKNRIGYSWTLSYFKAKWFAHRWKPKVCGVLKATVAKKDVHAVLLGRNEFEVVASPKMLQNVKTVRKQAKRLPWIEKALQDAWAGFQLSKNASFHGLWHWEKVEKNALALAKKTKGSDPLVAQLFALLHDCKRENEDEDPLHGHRAAEYIQTLKLPISDKQKEILMEACRYHNDGQTTQDPTIGVCWDADRLDLTRVGIIPDPKFLSTEVAKNSIWGI